MTPVTQELLRSLPSVSALLDQPEVLEWLNGLPRSVVVASLQVAIDSTRKDILDARLRNPVDVQSILARAEVDLAQRSTPSLRRVVNASGIVLHTGLGRAPLCDAAIEAIVESAGGYCNLEYDLVSGQRGRRGSHIAERLAELTGAEAATVVNNNAAATLLILHTLAAGREVIVSRGQLIEIGGSFRLPDIMAASGAILREVGTTNRTRVSDYENAINERTAMLLRVHTSNFRVVGFTEETTMEEIATLAHQRGLIAVDDLGSGALLDLGRYGLPEEPTVGDSLKSGTDLACFSGDKLLGGPQCGLIVGRKELIQRLEADPLMRTYRVDKLTLLALEATLRCYEDSDEAFASLPALHMLRRSTEELAALGQALCAQLQEAVPDERFFVCSDVSFAGGGSMPGRELPTIVVQWRPARRRVESMAAALRVADVPVVVRLRDDAICFDLRALRDADFEPLVSSVSSAVWTEETSEKSTDESSNGRFLPIL